MPSPGAALHRIGGLASANLPACSGPSDSCGARYKRVAAADSRSEVTNLRGWPVTGSMKAISRASS